MAAYSAPDLPTDEGYTPDETLFAETDNNHNICRKDMQNDKIVVGITQGDSTESAMR